MIWFLRMKKWATHPPPAARVVLVLAVVAAVLALAAFDHYVGWPEALTPNSTNPRTMLRP